VTVTPLRSAPDSVPPIVRTTAPLRRKIRTRLPPGADPADDDLGASVAVDVAGGDAQAGVRRFRERPEAVEQFELVPVVDGDGHGRARPHGRPGDHLLVEVAVDVARGRDHPSTRVPGARVQPSYRGAVAVLD
jgi:hypothetical protein